MEFATVELLNDGAVAEIALRPLTFNNKRYAVRIFNKFGFEPTSMSYEEIQKLLKRNNTEITKKYFV